MNPFILCISIILCLASLIFSIWVTEDPSDAGRGGALAVAISFVFLFSTSNQKKLFLESFRNRPIIPNSNAPKEDVKATEDVSDVGKILITSTYLDNLVNFRQNLYLAASSVIGTLSWGFADLIAKYFI